MSVNGSGVRDIPISFSHIRYTISYESVVRDRRSNSFPSVEHLMCGVDAAQHNGADHFVVIHPLANQVSDLREFLQQRGLKLSMTGCDDNTFTMFARYEYTSTPVRDTVRCQSVIVCLPASKRQVAVQLLLRFGRAR